MALLAAPTPLGASSGDLEHRLGRYGTLIPPPKKEQEGGVWKDLGVYTVAERYSSIEELACESVVEGYHHHEQPRIDVGLAERVARGADERVAFGLDERGLGIGKAISRGRGRGRKGAMWADITYFMDKKMVCLVSCRAARASGVSSRKASGRHGAAAAGGGGGIASGGIECGNILSRSLERGGVSDGALLSMASASGERGMSFGNSVEELGVGTYMDMEMRSERMGEASMGMGPKRNLEDGGLVWVREWFRV